MATDVKDWVYASADVNRLQALSKFEILDTPAERSFDRIAELLKLIFQCDVAIVSLIDGKRQWYKSVIGFESSEEPLETAFCRYTLVERRVIVVPDATRDPRFSSSDKVISAPFIRFYASAPILDRFGNVLGTICVVDFKPKELDLAHIAILERISEMVLHEMELQWEAGTDPLTGAYSRRRFNDDASKHVSLASRHNYELSCVSLDIDHFKSVNDTHGHAAGDLVLTNTISALRQNL
jgi:GAF domain-containing protein